MYALRRPLRSFCRCMPVIACVLLADCGSGALDYSAPLTLFDNFHVIELGRAYRSAQLDSESLRLVIGMLGIRTVVNLRGRHETAPWYRNERAVTEATGVELVDIEMHPDLLPSRDSLLLLYDTFTTAKHPILIHCWMGADRTGAAAAIWRMVMRGDPRGVAAMELSPLYGHLESTHPAMDHLVRIFQPDREWIETEYGVPDHEQGVQAAAVGVLRRQS